MNPTEVIAGLVQRQGGLCVLDKIHLPYAHADSGPAAKFGLGAELFLPDIDRAQLRERAVRFLVDYWQTFPERVDQFLAQDHRRTVRFRGSPEGKIEADGSKWPVEAGYSTSIFGEVDLGLPNDDVEPYQAHMLVGRADSRKLSFISATMPTCDEAGMPNFDTLLAAVLRWCTQSRPLHGSAGFTFIFASSMQQNTAYTLPMMKRFPGFDFQDGVDFSLEAGSVHDRIKCVNWLTVLCDALVNELGGLAAMRNALEPMCKVHEYTAGVVIQAGAFPLVGDVLRGDIPQAYQLVAKYTKPIRFENYGEGLFRVPDGLDDRDETLAWVRRFD